MQTRGKLAATLACAFALLAYQFVIHKVMISGQITPVTTTLVLAPLVIAAAWSAAFELGLRLALLIMSALAITGWAVVEMFGPPPYTLVFGLPHMVTNLFLMWFFTRTLKNGREPLITSIAKRVHGSLTPELEIYTRRVTLAWSLFFAAQIAGSVMLYLFATLQAWSAFINVLNAPLIVLMFVCEYTYRTLRYRDHRSSIFSGLHIFSHHTPAPKSTKER